MARWSAILPGARADAALAVATEIGTRLRDPDLVAECAARAVADTVLPDVVRCQPHNVAQGDAGIALLHGQLARCCPDRGWDVAAHHYLTSAVRGVRTDGHRPASVFAGPAGVAFVADALSREGTRYQRLLAQLDPWLATEPPALATTLMSSRGGPVGRFDAISGLAGTAAVLLRRRADPAVDAALRAVLAALVELCGEQDGLPNWYTASDAFGSANPMRAGFPHGNLNCGLSHGIPGPLAALSLACIEGVYVPGARAAVRRVADWLWRNRADDEFGVNWPSAIALPAPDGTVAAATPAHSAWCYGSPGVARALWLAGVALDAADLRTLAVEAMAATFRRPRNRRGLESATFCHGIAGLLQITLRFANDTEDPMFATAAAELTEDLLARYEPGRPLGYHSIEPGGNRVDQPGLLDGAAGVALTLLAAARGAAPSWDRIFLLG